MIKKKGEKSLINGVVELIGWEGKIGKLQKKLQNAAKTVHTVSGAVGSIAKRAQCRRIDWCRGNYRQRCRQ